ncbi:inositol monophosphatase family protein [Bacillus sp. JCM 19041]|uniref:inositol monophosphatase family protein n=1 Tax=Bacillus sp. JCM 19041 TaxID=1460637 RepID=UPI0006D2BAE8
MSLREAEIRIHSSFLRKEQPQNPAYQRVRQTELPTALVICAVAEGNTDIFMATNQTPYEFAAASLIAKEAGIEVMTLEGAELCWDQASSIWCGVV